MTGQRSLPLNALRVFEAAARQLSFAKAAEELHVTPSAVSMQIKALEEHFGTPLFRRSKRGIVLTPAGEILLPDVREGFVRLTGAGKRLRRHGSDTPLQVSVTPSLALKWLIGRLDQFRAKHPDVEVFVSASQEVIDFRKGEFDVALRYGSGNYNSLYYEKLLTNEVFPVYSPKLIASDRSIQGPADLLEFVLLHHKASENADEMPSWSDWFTLAGLPGSELAKGLHFSNSYLSTEAAIMGKGIALGVAPLVSDDLSTGRLLKPFSLSIKVDQAYYFVCPQEALKNPKVTAFHAWLKEEAGPQP